MDSTLGSCKWCTITCMNILNTQGCINQLNAGSIGARRCFEFTAAFVVSFAWCITDAGISFSEGHLRFMFQLGLICPVALLALWLFRRTPRQKWKRLWCMFTCLFCVTAVNMWPWVIWVIVLSVLNVDVSQDWIVEVYLIVCDCVFFVRLKRNVGKLSI